MEDKSWCVYLHTNKVNGKKYVGITSQEPSKRWNHGLGYKAQKKFWNAINKYGWDGFSHEILIRGLTFQEANSKEQELIKFYDSFCNGYNGTEGGDGCLGFKHSDSAKDKMSKARKGRVFDENWRKHLSESLSGKPRKQYQRTEAQKEKISESLSEYYRQNPNATKNRKSSDLGCHIICEGKEFVSISECADYYGIDNSKLGRWLSGKEYLPKFFVDNQLRYKNSIVEYVESISNINKVYFDGIIYDSITKCVKANHLAPNTLKKWIDGKEVAPVEVYFVPVIQYKIKNLIN